MHIGKIAGNILKRSVLKNIKYRSENLLVRPAVGVDCSRLRVSGQEMVYTMNPVCCDASIVGTMAFHRMQNDIVTVGSEPSCMMINILLPAQSEERDLKNIMRQLGDLANQHKVDILGGHTEVFKEISKPVLTIVGTGFVDSENKVNSSGLRAGQDLVMTGWAGAANSVQRVIEDRHKLEEHFPKFFLDDVEELIDQLSCVPAAKNAVKAGATALHNASSQGVLGALWEMCDVSGTGLEVDLKKIQICQETVEICEYYGDNPYQTASDGVLLIGTKDGEKMVQTLKNAGVIATVIGKATDSNDRIMINGEERSFLVPPGRD